MKFLNTEQRITYSILMLMSRKVRTFLFAVVIFCPASGRTQTPTTRPTPTPVQTESGIGFSTTGRASDSAAGRARTRQPHPELIVQTGHPASTGLAKIIFSPDGRLIATAASGSNEVRLWETVTGRALRVFRIGGKVVNGATPSVAFSGDGRVLAVGGSDGAIRLWEVLNGRELSAPVSKESLPGDNAAVRFLALDGNGSTLVLIGSSLQTWDVKTGREQGAFPARPTCASRGRIYSPARNADFAFTHDGNQLLQVSSEPGGSRNALGTAQITDPAQWGVADFRGRVLVKFIEVGSECESRSLVLSDVASYEGLSVAAVAYTPSGKALVAGLDGQKLKLWDLQAGGLPYVLADNSRNGRPILSFSPGGKFLALSDGTTIRVWEMAGGRQVGSFKTPAGTAAGAVNKHAVAVSPDGQWVATAGVEYPPTIWGAATGKLARRLSGAGNPAYEVRFTPDGKGLLSGGRTRWDLREGVAARLAADSETSHVLPSPDGALLAGISQRGDAITISEASTGRRLYSLATPNKSRRVRRLVFGAGGRILAALHTSEGHSARQRGDAADSLLRLWDVRTGHELHTFHCPNGVEDVRLSDDGRYLAVADSRANVTLWDLPSGSKLRSFDSTVSGVRGGGVDSSGSAAAGHVAAPVGFSPDGRLLAAGGILWDVAAGQTFDTLPINHGAARQIAFSGDGRLLALSTADNSIKVLNLREKREVLKLPGHAADINSLAFSPDGTLIASASHDGSTNLWDVKTGAHLATLVSLFDGGEWLVITPDGLFDGTPASWNQILWRYDEDTFNVAPVEWFFNEFYYPGLLSEIFAGKRPKAPQSFELKERRQPLIALSLTDAQEQQKQLSSRYVTVRILVQEDVRTQGESEASGAHDLRLFRNGSLVRAWHGDVLDGRRSAVLETTIPLVAGENQLVAYAFNRDNVKSRDAQLTIIGDDGLRRAGVTHILSVGVNNYANPQFNLRYAVADAQAFAEELSRQQERIGLGRAKVISLHNEDATKGNILHTIAGLASELQPEDTLIIYFAGHGLARGDRFYILPNDLGYRGHRGKLDEAGLEEIVKHSISDRDLEAAFEKVDVGRLLLVIDACHSGQALESEERRRGPMNSKGLAQLAYEKGMYVLTAAQSHQAALEASELGHGLLTYALIEEGLKTAVADARPRDGAIFAREWFTYAVERVPQMQVSKIASAQKAGRDLYFRDEERGLDVESRSGQQPRLFFRREVETKPLLIAKPWPRRAGTYTGA